MKKAIAALVILTSFVSSPFTAELYAKKSAKKDGKYVRVYSKPLKAAEKKDISYILKTLGLGGITKIISNRNSMKKAGDRIRPIHPLKFLSHIFSDEELKACAHNIRHSRIPMVWSEFWGGLRDSLADESKGGNLTDAQIADFSQSIGISQDKISPLLRNGQWLEFFDTLLKEVPRSDNATRYNI